MKTIYMVSALLVLMYGCKKADNTHTGNVTLQLQNEKVQYLTMGAITASITNPNCSGPSIFADSCKYAGRSDYLLFFDYNAKATGSGNSSLVWDFKEAGLFQDTSQPYLLYSYIKNGDSLVFLTNASYQTAPFGPRLTYIDVNGEKWDSDTGNTVENGFFITSPAPPPMPGPNSFYTIIKGNFSCNVYNSAGASKTLTGMFSNDTVLIPY
jgi:hypothetical protein